MEKVLKEKLKKMLGDPSLSTLKVLKETSRINLPGTSLERQIKTSVGRHFRMSPGRQIATSAGRSNRISRGRPGDVGGGILRTSWGPIFSHWEVSINSWLYSLVYIFLTSFFNTSFGLEKMFCKSLVSACFTLCGCSVSLAYFQYHS